MNGTRVLRWVVGWVCFNIQHFALNIYKSSLHLVIIIFCLFYVQGNAQTLGGNAVFNFLKLPATPLLSAAGGINVSYHTNEVGLSANNPALLDSTVDTQLNFSFNHFIAGIKTYGLTGSRAVEKINTQLGGHIYFVDYGSIPQTDAAGNLLGSFHPVDYVVQVSAARTYLEHWRYGLTLKFIHSGYQQYTSNAMAADVGILYTSDDQLFSAAFLAKNMGIQLKTYAGEGEDLPFDLQLGVTKRLAKAPLGFSITAQHLQRFNIRYEDTTFYNQDNSSSKYYFFNQLFNHIVVGGHIYAGNNLEALIGFNYLRRQELKTGAGSGLNGFSMGIRIKLQKLQFLYARSGYQRNITYNQVGFNIQLNRFFGSGKL